MIALFGPLAYIRACGPRHMRSECGCMCSPHWHGSSVAHTAANEPARKARLILVCPPLLFSPLLNHTHSQVLNGAIAAALFNLIYTYLLSQRIKWYAMCPWLDLINHRGTVEARPRPRGRPRAGFACSGTLQTLAFSIPPYGALCTPEPPKSTSLHVMLQALPAVAMLCMLHGRGVNPRLPSARHCICALRCPRR